LLNFGALPPRDKHTPCSLGLSATSQQYFSLRTNQPTATSRNQPAVLFSQNKPAPAISHQPTEQADKSLTISVSGILVNIAPYTHSSNIVKPYVISHVHTKITKNIEKRY
jgi:hypothetical protein